MCDLCRQSPCHSQCPNYKYPKTKYYCSICKDGIYPGEEYIENDNNGEYAHWNCIDTAKEAITWLGYEIKEMKGKELW